MSVRSKEAAAMVKGVFCDAYIFYQKYHGKPMEPGLWESATADFAQIMKKYDGAPICGRIMLATFTQLEDEKNGRFDNAS
jgi:hypothetical protein